MDSGVEEVAAVALEFLDFCEDAILEKNVKKKINVGFYEMQRICVRRTPNTNRCLIRDDAIEVNCVIVVISNGISIQN